MKHLTYILLLLLLTACTGKTQPMKTKAKDNPEVHQMLEAFNKQKHRIAFNGCEMLYNGKPFKLGMTIKELETVFGKYDLVNRERIFVWKEVGITMITDSKIDKVIQFSIYMNTKVSEEYKESLQHELYHKQDYFLLEGMPINRNMQFRDFIKNSHFELSDFSITNYGYDLRINCDDGNLLYSLDGVGRTWIYKGGGHIMLKDHPNTDNKSTIETFYISKIDKEEN